MTTLEVTHTSCYQRLFAANNINVMSLIVTKLNIYSRIIMTNLSEDVNVSPVISVNFKMILFKNGTIFYRLKCGDLFDP